MNRLKVLMPFYVVDEPRFSRYVEQLKAVENNIDELHICYLIGEKPHYDFNFHLLNPSRKFDIDFSKPYIYRFVKRYFRYLDYIHRIPDNDYDLIYCLSGGCMSQVSYLMMKFNLDIPVICRIRGNGLEERALHQNSNIRKRILNFIEKNTYSVYDRLIPISLNLKNELESRGYTNVSNVIPNGVNTKKFTSHGYPDDLVVGYIGRISRIKGSDFLIDLMNRTPNIKYLVAGDNQEGVVFPSNVEYVGFIDHDSIPSLINRCSLTILTSYNEGLSNTLLESYACGRMMIMTPESHPSDIPVFGHEIKHDINSWKYVLTNLKYDDYVFQGIQARRWVEKLSWERYGERMVSEFRRVLNDE